MPRETPARTGFRRRLPLELLPEEQALLERQQAGFASKRETLVAGLHALAHQSELEQELERATAARDQAHTVQAALEKKLAHAEAALAKQREETAKAKRGSASSERTQQRAQVAAETRAQQLEGELQQGQLVQRQLEQELDELAECALDAAFCHRCGNWIPAANWDKTIDEGREFVHCGRCGFETGGTFSTTSVFGYREDG